MTALVRLLRLFVEDWRFAAAILLAVAVAALAPWVGLPAAPALALLLGLIFAVTLRRDAGSADRRPGGGA